ncbi:MAG: hypothetical protein ACI92G_002964 [Candidatus Pelagisphaera sp.]|jgi:hypothetical protein
MKVTLEKNPKLLVEFVGLKSKSDMNEFIHQKAEGIFRRYPGLEGIRIFLKQESDGSGSRDFVAKARLILPGYDRIIEKRGAAAFEAISEMFEVADRQLRKRARLFKTKQRHEPI